MKKIFTNLLSLVLAFTAHAQTDQNPEENKNKAMADQIANDALPNATLEEKKAAWLTSIKDGLAKAKAEKKLVMLEFTGSDWCPPCMMMAKKVFGKKAFLNGVKKDYVIVKLDMPQSDPKLSKANDLLMRSYKVRGVPTILLLDAEGVEFSRFVASEERTVKQFLARLAKEKRRKSML